LKLCQAILVPYDKRIVDENGVIRQESDYVRIAQKRKLMANGSPSTLTLLRNLLSEN